MELLIGCGSTRDRRIKIEGRTTFSNLVTLDANAAHGPDVIHDLNSLPYPFEANAFDEIHAYEVLEHCGRQGDWEFFFAQFSEFWRILKPGGFLAATCPSFRSLWAWGDPSHTRIFTSGTLVFLDQDEYRRQVGKTAMSDFRFCYHADFKPIWIDEDEECLRFVIQAHKEST